MITRTPPLRCTVRGCGEALRQHARIYTCARGHTYDRARRGYVNLLQPQDRRSAAAGDRPEAVEARARLVAAGAGTALLDSLVEQACALPLPGDLPGVVDLGCGTGELLARLAAARSIDALGIDLSVPAVAAAARRAPAVTWVVANADRQLPVTDGAMSLVLSVHARRNPAECQRILDPRGFLLVAVPAPEDLQELRAAVQGAAVQRDRTDALVAEHAAWFRLVDRREVRHRLYCSRELLLDLLRGTYRGARAREAERVQEIDALDVTLASDVILFAPKGEGRRSLPHPHRRSAI